MTWTHPDARTSEQGGAPVFHPCGGQWKLNCTILRELLPSIDEYNEWSFCAVVTFSSHTSWNLVGKTSRKSVLWKVRFTRVFWHESVQLFYLRSIYIVVSVFKFLYLEKNVHVRHMMLDEHQLQLIIFDLILNSSDVFASVTSQQMDVGASFKLIDSTASVGSIENGGRVHVHCGVKNISHVCWSDVKLTTEFKFKFITDADTSGRVHVMDQTDQQLPVPLKARSENQRLHNFYSIIQTLSDMQGVPSRLLLSCTYALFGMLDFSTHVLLSSFSFVALSSLLRISSGLCRSLSHLSSLLAWLVNRSISCLFVSLSTIVLSEVSTNFAVMKLWKLPEESWTYWTVTWLPRD